MNLRSYISTLLSWIIFLMITSGLAAQNIYEGKQVEVALRMIGHQILLRSGDSTSRVLPVIKNQYQYRIQFEAEFEFDPDEVVIIVDSVVRETGMANRYIVEVEKCETRAVVYSYEVDHLEQKNIIPCQGRAQPKSCYNLVFSFMEGKGKQMASQAIAEDSGDVVPSLENSGAYIPFVFLILILGAVFLALSKKKEKADPNLIRLGKYHFDKLKNELQIDRQKIDLTSKEADLLLLLYNEVNTTIEREVILNKVWGDEGGYVGRTLDVFISKLRKKLEADTNVQIVNIRGVGYKLVMD